MSTRVVVITGASSGVDRACAREFGRWGDRVALVARNAEALTRAAAEVCDEGGEALALAVDVADADAVESAAAQVTARWRCIDVWVNCAMATVFAPVHQLTAHEVRRVTEATYLSYVHGTLAALRHMRPADSGTIVQVGSGLSFRSIPLQSAYCAAKAAIRAFGDSLRTELLHEGSGVAICQVRLPAVNTPQSLRQRNKMPRQQQPIPPLFAPEDVAQMIVAAAAARPGRNPTWRAVWAQALIPGLLDRYAARTAWDAQFVEAPNRQHADILFATLPGDPGARGPYRDRERGPNISMRLRLRWLRLTATAGPLSVGPTVGTVTDRKPGHHEVGQRERP